MVNDMDVFFTVIYTLLCGFFFAILKDLWYRQTRVVCVSSLDANWRLFPFLIGVSMRARGLRLALTLGCAGRLAKVSIFRRRLEVRRSGVDVLPREMHHRNLRMCFPDPTGCCHGCS